MYDVTTECLWGQDFFDFKHSASVCWAWIRILRKDKTAWILIFVCLSYLFQTQAPYSSKLLCKFSSYSCSSTNSNKILGCVADNLKKTLKSLKKVSSRKSFSEIHFWRRCRQDVVSIFLKERLMCPLWHETKPAILFQILC